MTIITLTILDILYLNTQTTPFQFYNWKYLFEIVLSNEFINKTW